jgi:hypothetical protein
MRVIKVEMIFSYQCKVRVRRSGEGSIRWWCRFNALVLTREGRRRDKALPEDEAETASSPWLNGKEA